MLTKFISKESITLVALSLILLKTNIKNRIQQLNLNVEIYEENFIHSTNLQLLSYESLKENSTFYDYLNSLIQQKKSIRLFFDEAHLIIMHREFRYIMKYLSNINKFNIQLIFLFASFTQEIMSELTQ